MLMSVLDTDKKLKQIYEQGIGRYSGAFSSVPFSKCDNNDS